MPEPTIRAVIPYLIVDGAAAAIDWYREVFGAEEVARMTGGAGRIAHAELRIGPSSIFIADEHVQYEEILGPPRIGGTPVYLDLETDDVAGVFTTAPSPPARRASARRPTRRWPVQSAKVRDPFGHIWLITRSDWRQYDCAAVPRSVVPSDAFGQHGWHEPIWTLAFRRSVGRGSA